MKKVVATVIAVCFLAVLLCQAQQDRKVEVTIPFNRVVEVRSMCDDIQVLLDPVPASYSLAQCFRNVVLARSGLDDVSRKHKAAKDALIRDVDASVQ